LKLILKTYLIANFISRIYNLTTQISTLACLYTKLILKDLHMITW